MWNDLLAAVALVMVIEGLLPFLSPDTLRRTMQNIIQLPNRILRSIGLASMVGGTILLYLIRHA